MEVVAGLKRHSGFTCSDASVEQLSLKSVSLFCDGSDDGHTVVNRVGARAAPLVPAGLTHTLTISLTLILTYTLFSQQQTLTFTALGQSLRSTVTSTIALPRPFH